MLGVATLTNFASVISITTVPFHHQKLVSTGGMILAKKVILVYDCCQTFSPSFIDFITDIFMMHLIGSEET